MITSHENQELDEFMGAFVFAFVFPVHFFFFEYMYFHNILLRPGDCKYRDQEMIFKTEITDFFIFCQEKPFGKLFSKISLKLAREFLV